MSNILRGGVDVKSYRYLDARSHGFAVGPQQVKNVTSTE